MFGGCFFFKLFMVFFFRFSGFSLFCLQFAKVFSSWVLFGGFLGYCPKVLCELWGIFKNRAF